MRETNDFKIDRSIELFERAKRIIPGGANSNIRCGSHYRPAPLFLDRGRGSHVWDADGNEYVDYLMAYGPALLGHAHPEITRAVRAQLDGGTIFGAPTELALKVAYLFTSMVPNAEMVRFTNTGSEATMHAIRIARAHTGRDKIIKFEGAYHGTHDYVLTGLFPFLGLEHHPIHAPFSPGVPSETLKSVILATWNDVQLLEKIVKDHQGEIAAIITEPLMASAACIMPEEGYLQAIRELCDDHGIVFILDEVMTGFRLAPGGAQEYFGVDADLATFAKILGGGLPVAAVAGKGEFMEHVGPGRIFFAGTFNGNPLGLAASRAVLSILRDNRPLYSSIFKTAETLISGIQEILERAGERVLLQGPGPMFQLCFTELERITKVRQLALVDKEKYRDLVWSLFSRGVYAHPLFAERWMLSAAHTSEDIDLTLAAFEDVARSELSGKE